MQKNRRFGSILHLFLVLLVVIVIIPMIAVLVITYSGIVNRLLNTYDTLTQVTSYAAADSIGEALGSVNSTSLAIIGNTRICDFLTRDPQDIKFFDVYTSASDDVETYCQNNRYIMGVRIDGFYGRKTLSTGGIGGNYEITDAEKKRMREFHEPWFWTKENNGKVGICRLIRNKNDNFAQIGYMKIILREDALFGQLPGIPKTDYALLDTRDDQVILASSDSAKNEIEEIFTKNYMQIKYGRHIAFRQKAFFINIRRLGSKSISVATISSDQTVYVNVIKYGHIALVCVLFLLTSVVYTVLYKNIVITPLEALSASMRMAKEEDPAPPLVDVRTWGEIRDLVHSFNQMSRKISHLYETNYKNELKLKDAHLLILQSEINPHFLYNVLNSIHWMIELDEKASANAMVQLLAKSFRMSLHLSDCSFIALEKELEHLNIYIGIEQYRFQDKISIHLNIQKNLTSAKVVKFVLQPLVENAIVHGIQKSATGRGKVIVSIYCRDGNLIYDVRDNGIGADSGRVQGILNGKLIKEHSLEGFALENIQSRLVLGYGPDYGISYHPREGGGSVFTVTQPYILEQGGEGNVSTDDSGR